MFFNRYLTVLTGIIICTCIMSTQAEFYPERIYKERTKFKLNIGWRFIQNDNTSYSDSGFSDGGWYPVNIPHSASYDAPTPSGENNGFQGVCWYRNKFTIPQTKHSGKYFIQFDGAMQAADVWLNGKKLGTHDNSGYTWFSFDVTDKVSSSGTNVLAVRLDNRYSLVIPPGDDATTGYPDYYIFSGLYRNVWLICTDQCFIPLYGQQISIPRNTASSANASVKINTTVTTSTAGNVTVRYVIANPSNRGILIDSATQSLTANQSFVFSKICGPIASPALWSPADPNLYTLYTQVFKDGILVDDYVDRFGVRWYDWTPTDGFSLNGATTIIKGASLHQSIAWIENAQPRSRFAKEVGMVKEMGANLIRCAHFPRDPSFYNACDELGMMVMVEVPTWGNGSKTGYADAFWVRLNNCMKELIQVGYNHPSIIAWGTFNEPQQAFNSPNQLPLLNTTAHTMDSTRLTYYADNALNNPDLVNHAADIEGMNYNELWGPCASTVARIVNTEYHQGWIYWCYRGGQNDNESSTGYAMQRWNLWTGLFTIQRVNKLAGACMWSFNDYWSPFVNSAPMGVVDEYRIPKAVFYLFRKQWTGKASETPVPGLTPTKLRLDSDMDSLIADSTDIAIITASFRTAGDTCVDTKSGPTDSIPVTFSVNGPANYLGPLTVKAFAGKCALIIKSKNSTGAITVSATAPNLPAATPVTIKSVAPDTSSLPFITPVIENHENQIFKNMTIKQQKNSLIITFPSRSAVNKDIYLFDLKGQMVSCPITLNRTNAIVDTKKLSAGYYCLSVGKNADYKHVIKQIFIAK